MRKKVSFLFLALFVVMMSITGCGGGPANLVNTAVQLLAGDVTGEIGKTYATDWFRFTIHSIEEVDSYAGHTPADDWILYDVVITETNIFDESIPMGTFDFYMDDPSFEEFIWAMEPLDGSMMPESFDLEPGDTVQYHMVFEIPAEVTDLVLMYTEIDERETEGRTFTIHIDRD